MNPLYTIGHSTHDAVRFIQLLQMHAITALCDVRSSPYSKYNPQFNREIIQADLIRHGIAYVYLGRELGPRSGDPACYVNGRVKYDRIIETNLFKEGIHRLMEGIKKYRVALMCAEKDPATCHRTILICRELRTLPSGIFHILEDGSLESHPDMELRLLKMLKIPERQLFETSEDLIRRAYRIQSEKIAYSKKTVGEEEEGHPS